MARLVVEAVSGEPRSGDIGYVLEMFVTVSRADDGSPVTGLSWVNFQICSSIGSANDMKVHVDREANWDIQDVEAAGCYSLMVTYKYEHNYARRNWVPGAFYMLGIQARIFESTQPDAKVTDMGQTVVRIKSLGT